LLGQTRLRNQFDVKHLRRNIMAKGQLHKNKEAKKPKQSKKAVVMPGSTVMPSKPSMPKK
jgi:hypothetical protein